jgi:tRNA threonylcarbamoyladenosine dehydratase
LNAESTTRSFSSIERLLGGWAFQRIANANILVVGVGGVGSWAAEALARSGVGHLALMDLDHIAESNINRQVHALHSTVGAAKVEVMAQRIAQINPQCQVTAIDAFLDEANLPSLFAPEAKPFDVIIDAIDQVRVKALLIAAAAKAQVPVVVCGAAGGKDDPTKITQADLALTTNDPLLASLRQRLRREHGFPKPDNKRTPAMRVACIYSTQAMAQASPVEDGAAGLACAGYGSIVTVTASLGFAAAAAAIKMLK